MVAYQWKKGRPGARLCKAIARWSGRPCGNLAMRNAHVCRVHGGYGQQAQHRLREAKRAKVVDEGRRYAGKFKRAGRSTSQG
jgi:hypothetical protein